MYPRRIPRKDGGGGVGWLGGNLDSGTGGGPNKLHTGI